MDNQKERISLTEERETLLITLMCKAIESRKTNPILVDEKAVRILEQIDYDFSGLKVPKRSAVTMCIRSKKMDSYVRRYLESNPAGTVLHLGCGLDDRFGRVDNGQVKWYDVDFSDVLDLRRHFYADSERCQMVPSSLSDLGWVSSIGNQDGPVLVVGEGVMMYLEEAEVRALVLKLREAFSGCSLVMDVYNTMVAKNMNRHPSIKKTGAIVKWGIDDPASVEGWAEGISLKEEWFFAQSEDIGKLGLVNWAMFRLANLLPAGRRSHRILHYQL